ncbi:hypothetical protein BVG79_00577 [Ketogulonicigenium robustum]|uniref:Uncharacterized protein n=1 Tax=Ketogulonicigenium robustum TaxID=92947 RepID=A0A1W6NXL5_9RHOB|nr:hypothetical protein BVG79_00577 [Ketogulonicigenium robustum]
MCKSRTCALFRAVARGSCLIFSLKAQSWTSHGWQLSAEICAISHSKAA